MRRRFARGLVLGLGAAALATAPAGAATHHAASDATARGGGPHGHHGHGGHHGHHGHGGHHGHHGHGRPDHALRKIRHFVVIYEENHSFDNLYGGWERVDGLRDADAAHTTPGRPARRSPTSACCRTTST